MVDRAGRVAVLSDVHGNPFALEAVLAEVAREEPNLVVFGGDLTWGPLPHETLELVWALELPTRFVRGNAERLLLEGGDDPDERRQWLLTQHTDAELAFLSKQVQRLEGLLGSDFTTKAAPETVQRERERLDERRDRLATLERRRATLAY